MDAGRASEAPAPPSPLGPMPVALLSPTAPAPHVGGSAPKPTPKVTIDDFVLHKLVGRGAFGKVFLVSHKLTGRRYAMKVMQKGFLASQRDYLAMATLEKDIMTRLRHPYIVQLRYAFQSPKQLFLVSGTKPQAQLPPPPPRLSHCAPLMDGAWHAVTRSRACQPPFSLSMQTFAAAGSCSTISTCRCAACSLRYDWSCDEGATQGATQGATKTSL